MEKFTTTSFAQEKQDSIKAMEEYKASCQVLLPREQKKRYESIKKCAEDFILQGMSDNDRRNIEKACREAKRRCPIYVKEIEAILNEVR